MKILRQLISTCLLGAAVSVAGFAQEQRTDYPIQPVDFIAVKFTEGFWKDRLETVKNVTIPYAFEKCEETGRINNFIYAGGLKEGKFKGQFGFDDSDVYKILEGASYSLMLEDDPELRAYVDTLVSYVAAAQEDDGYLYTAWTLKANDYANMTCCSYDAAGKFVGSRMSHELYNAGHMYEAAVAHYRATGEKNFLNIATKNADLIYHLCVEEGQEFYPGHQEIEIGLVKLYRATGEEKYLELAKLFLDRRGHGLRQYDNEKDAEYAQDHKPVTEQDAAVGHSVRAAYMYSAMADIAAITGDEAYLAATDKIWNNIVSKKLYITGGLGAGNGIEGFDKDYVLPNDAYAETCAAIANVYWNHRMFLLHGEAKYIDVLERTLYNGLIAGLSMEGDKFFYPNPLEFNGTSKFNQGAVCRSPWFDCSCCPSNLSRFVPSLGGYIYAVNNDNLYVNLFASNQSDMMVNDKKFSIAQSTNYPWSGDVTLAIENEEPITANLMIRIPGWAMNEPVPSDLYRFEEKASQKATIQVNGENYPFTMKNGYAIVTGDWKKGDKVEIKLPMEVKTIVSNEQVAADAGKTAVQYGPIVYCAEEEDNGKHIMDIRLDNPASLRPEFKKGLLEGVTVLDGKGWITDGNQKKEKVIQLIPYYSWNHRKIGEMTVWFLDGK